MAAIVERCLSSGLYCVTVLENAYWSRGAGGQNSRRLWVCLDFFAYFFYQEKK